MQINLLKVMEYLEEHHDVMFILPGQNGALVFDQMLERVIIIWGDFSGTPEENSAELRIGLERHHAWLN